MNCAAPTSDKDKEPPNCNRRHPWIRSVLEVGLYGLVTHTGTSSLTGLKPFHHFFLTTLIHRKSFVVTKHVFWAQNTTYAFAYSVPSWLGRSSGRGGMKGERKRRGGAYQISSRYRRLRYNYFRFGRTNGRHIGIPPCRFWPGRSNLHMLFWIKLPNFVQIGPPAAESWRHIQLKMAFAAAPYYFRFVFHVTLTEFLKVNVYRHTCIHAWDITTSGLEKNNRPPY